MNRQQCGDCWREEGGGEGGINGDGRRLDLGGEHALQCTEDVLWDCGLKACIILLTCVTPINSTKRKMNDNKKIEWVAIILYLLIAI